LRTAAPASTADSCHADPAWHGFNIDICQAWLRLANIGVHVRCASLTHTAHPLRFQLFLQGVFS
jgi:hypothetical protein